jgi:hypothetical protein
VLRRRSRCPLEVASRVFRAPLKAVCKNKRWKLSWPTKPSCPVPLGCEVSSFAVSRANECYEPSGALLQGVAPSVSSDANRSVATLKTSVPSMGFGPLPGPTACCHARRSLRAFRCAQTRATMRFRVVRRAPESLLWFLWRTTVPAWSLSGVAVLAPLAEADGARDLREVGDVKEHSRRVPRKGKA